MLPEFRKNISGQKPEIPGEGMHTSYSGINSRSLGKYRPCKDEEAREFEHSFCRTRLPDGMQST